MSSPDFRQPDPAASLTGALGAQRKLTETLREESEKIRREAEPTAVTPSDAAPQAKGAR